MSNKNGIDFPALKKTHKKLNVERLVETDVFIAGSGPIGCAIARTIIDKNKNARVFMSEVGSHSSPQYGWHHKNEVGYQKDIDKFVNVIKGALSTISVPPNDTYVPTLDPAAWSPDSAHQLILSGHNPSQDPFVNLGASAVTRTVGGMATHWTCATPNPHPDELPDTFTETEWTALYARAKKMVKTTETAFDDSMRHNVVKDTLNNAYKETDPTRVFKNLPLAVERRVDNPEFVTWTGSDTILGDLATPGANEKFVLESETRTTSFVHLNNEIMGVIVRDLRKNEDFVVQAKAYVAACGAVLTPQLLWNSYIRPPALGRYLTEQSMTFCQIALKRDIIESIWTDPKYKEKVDHHKAVAPKDPLPIPFGDPEPQVTMPYSTERPWHTQIHRDAFSYGDVGPTVDARLVVDLRFFGKTEINPDNRVEFAEVVTVGGAPGIRDSYGMPQATFFYKQNDTDRKNNHDMMADMCEVASHLGGYIPGSNPQFMEPGLALHIMGTIRAGEDENTSVVDKNSKVHNISNLWLGGNGVIPTAMACNPTLTSICYALQAADSIVEFLDNRTA